VGERPAGDTRAAAAQAVREALKSSELEWEEPRHHVFALTLPGTRKLQTPCRIEVGEHALALHAFVARRPDENHEVVYRWLLEKNLRQYAVFFALDYNGDIYLNGRLPLHAVDVDEVDRLLGSVLTYADESFNTILELGFAGSIRKEWEWRKTRGEPTHNLDAFRGWLEREDESSSPS
jgi:Putative bacterial sensory transduction regulator